MSFPVRPAKRHRSRLSPSEIRAKRKNVLGTLIVAGVITITAAGAAAFYALKPPPRDEMTGCLSAAAPASLTTILIDSSDPLSQRQEADIRGKLEDIRRSIAANGRVEIYSLVGKPDALLAPIVAACNPGDPNKVNPFFASQRIAEDQWQALFVSPFDRAIRESLSDNPSKNSPIMEAIQSIAIESLARDLFKDVPRRLIIVSDLIQNTPALNQYRDRTSFGAFSSGPYYRRVRADLRGVSVTVLYVWRDTTKAIQGRTHAEFWNELLSNEGA